MLGRGPSVSTKIRASLPLALPAEGLLRGRKHKPCVHARLELCPGQGAGAGGDGEKAVQQVSDMGSSMGGDEIRQKIFKFFILPFRRTDSLV